MGEDLERLHLVAWIDLLGFGEMLVQKPLDEVVGLLRDHLPTAVAEMTQDIQYADGGYTVAGTRCEVEQFQDTLVLWTWKTDLDALDALVKTTETLVAVLHMNGYPVRGAISSGTLYTARLDPTLKEPRPAIVIGRGVIAAARLEKKGPGAGIVIDAKGHDGSVADWGEIVRDLQESSGVSGRIHPYEIDSGETCLLVGWPSVLKHETPEKILATMWPAGRPNQPNDASKFDETEAYLHWWMDPQRYGLDHKRLERATRLLSGD